MSDFPTLPDTEAALLRLAQASYGRDNAQAQIITAWLGSMCNGADTYPVRLDDLHRLDGWLQSDLLLVLLSRDPGLVKEVMIRKAYGQVAQHPRGADWLDQCFRPSDQTV